MTSPNERPSGERPPLVLASASPRRRRLVSWLGVPVELTAVDTPEDLSSPLAADPPRLAEHLASEKALAARSTGERERVILAFDTIVVLDGEVLGKPQDLDDAWRMLRGLSGRTHEVVTGCAILRPDAETPEVFSVVTQVRMRDLSDADIEAWAAKGELLGCAGAYNIEAQIASVEPGECFQNVAGLPLCHLYAELAKHDIPEVSEALRSPRGACDVALGVCCVLGPRIAG